MDIRQKGFTLIELLVVISIIGLLSSIAITSLNQAKTKALDAQVNVQVNEYFKAFMLYKEDNGQYFEAWSACLGPEGSVCGYNDANAYEQDLDGALSPYLSSPKINDRKIVLFDPPYPMYWRGVEYSCYVVRCSLLQIHFFLEGKTHCARPAADIHSFYENPAGESNQHTECLYLLQ